MNACSVIRFSRPAGLFSFGFLDGLHVRLCRPYLRETPASLGLGCLTTACMNNPGGQDGEDDRQHRSRCAEILKVPQGYASVLCSLRPRWTAVLTILRAHEEFFRSPRNKQPAWMAGKS